jgi:hypothetical protein
VMNAVNRIAIASVPAVCRADARPGVVAVAVSRSRSTARWTSSASTTTATTRLFNPRWGHRRVQGELTAGRLHGVQPTDGELQDVIKDISSTNQRSPLKVDVMRVGARCFPSGVATVGRRRRCCRVQPAGPVPLTYGRS